MTEPMVGSLGDLRQRRNAELVNRSYLALSNGAGADCKVGWWAGTPTSCSKSESKVGAQAVERY